MSSGDEVCEDVLDMGMKTVKPTSMKSLVWNDNAIMKGVCYERRDNETSGTRRSSRPSKRR